MSEEYYYYYTSFSRAKPIFLKGKIEPSVWTGAAYINGVYLTTLGPELGKETVLKNNWDGVRTSLSGNIECYFQILIPVEKATRAKGKSDIHIYAGNLLLSEYKWSLRNWEEELLATEHFIVRSEGEAAKERPDCMGRYTLCRQFVMPDGTPVYKHDHNQMFLYKSSNDDIWSTADMGTYWCVGPVAGDDKIYLVQYTSSLSPNKTEPWKYLNILTFKTDETLRVDPIYVNHVTKKLKRSSTDLNDCNSPDKQQRSQ